MGAQASVAGVALRPGEEVKRHHSGEHSMIHSEI